MAKDIFQCTIENTIQREWGVRGLIYHNFKADIHRHEYYEINIIYSGTGKHHLSDETFDVSAGDVFMIPPYVTHGYSDTDGLDVFHLLFHPDFINDNLDEALTIEGFTLFTEIEPFLRGNADVPRFLHLNAMELDELERDLDVIDSAGKYKGLAHLPIKRHVALKVLYELSLKLYDQTYADSKKESSKYEQQIFQALEYIHANYERKLTVEMLSKKVFLSRSTFIRNFQLVCKTSPHEYIRAYRQNKAAELLRSGVLKKSDIARKCGYYDLSHMNHAVK